MSSIKTEIIINASANQVWNQLMDFKNYQNWNPFIKSIEGKAEEGTILTNEIKLEGQAIQVFKPTVKKVVNNQEFRWLGSMPLNMFNGEHYFQIVPINAQKVKLIHGENFTGWLSWLILKLIGQKTINGFHAMNNALKQSVEK